MKWWCEFHFNAQRHLPIFVHIMVNELTEFTIAPQYAALLPAHKHIFFSFTIRFEIASSKCYHIDSMQIKVRGTICLW